MSGPLLSSQLLQVAASRVNEESHRTEANLRRATSDLYYAVFHAICETLVGPLGNELARPGMADAYINIYRTPQHGYVERRCNIVAGSATFGPVIASFARHFMTMKNKRELADYHPLETFSISIVRNDLQATETRLSEFWGLDDGLRTAFALYVAVRFGKDSTDRA